MALLAYYLGLWRCAITWARWNPTGWQGASRSSTGSTSALRLRCRQRWRATRRTVVIAERKLLKMATLDGLTGLYNRSHFQSQARQVLAACERTQEPVALLLCDIDHFKQVNDTHGHAVGDQVLQATAKIMTRTCAQATCWRARGEEFLALLPRTSPTAALEAAEPHPRGRGGVHTERE